MSALSDLVTQVDEPVKQKNRGCCAALFGCCSPKQHDGAEKVPTKRAGPGPVDISMQEPNKYLLPALDPDVPKKKCLVLDLDETLVHSSFTPIMDPDFKITIELEGRSHQVYVRKRPYVDEFLAEVAKKFEIVIFTASLSKYADPLLDILDPAGVVQSRLFREDCVQHYGNFVKDLTHLGRGLANTIIVDNSPFSYMFQPDNAVPIGSWFDDRSDRQLEALLPFLDELADAEDVVPLLKDKDWSFLDALS